MGDYVNGNGIVGSAGYVNGHASTNGYHGLANINGSADANGAPHFKGTGNTNTAAATHIVPEPIAIVGMAMRLPGGIRSEQEFWDLLINKRTTKGPIPPSRYNVDGFYSESGLPGSTAVLHGHFLSEADGLDLLDTSFFTTSKAEVEKLDPQQRMLLEVVWECMENAGQRDWRGSNIGVFVGTWGDDWVDVLGKDPQQVGGMLNVLGAHDYAIANRVSYEYDLHGPSFAIKTACSSSTISLHQAVQAIRQGECDASIVAGTNIIITPTQTIAQSEGSVLSPTGECRTFDADANGYSRGEAVNALLLKKLSSAVRDRDSIRAVIRSTAVNSDGRSAGLSTPNPKAHARLIRQAYMVGGLSDPSETPFVEVHGTGTRTGDPLEVEAIAEVFGSSRDTWIGGVKANVGHGESASGVTSVIKAVLALENRTIPPQANFTTPNPKIPFKEARLIVPLEPTAWPEGRPERISVNSFGISGANAHVVVESAASYGYEKENPPIDDKGGKRSPELLLVSATNALSLKQRCDLFQSYAIDHPNELRDLAYTLDCRRELLSHRAYIVSDGHIPTEIVIGDRIKTAPKITLVFTGQGAQSPAMGKELTKRFPSFKADLIRLSKSLQQLPHPPTWNLLDEILLEGPKSQVNKAEFAQPLTTALQIALFNLLRSLGINPDGVVGHSSGEIAAAYAAGALSAERAMAAAYYRGLITTQLASRGAMAAVGISRVEATLYLENGAVVACDNSPQSATLSGDEDAIESVIKAIRSDDPSIFVRRLKTDSMAYHSHHMAEIGETYEQYLQGIVTAETPKINFFSTVTGGLLKDKTLGPQYWRQNLESQVRFFPAVKAAIEAGGPNQLFLEVGPHAALAGPLRQIFKASSSKARLGYCSSLVRGKNDQECILEMCGQLFLQAVKLDLQELTSEARLLTTLPTYPWRHDVSHWTESRIVKEWRHRKFPPHELLGSRILENNDFNPTWRVILRIKDVMWLQDHKVYDDVVFPCACYIAMAGEAMRQLSSCDDFSIRNLRVKSALVLQDKPVELMTSLRRSRLVKGMASDWYEFSIVSHNGNVWIDHCHGEVRHASDDPTRGQAICPVEDLPRRVSSPYDSFEAIGLYYGPYFQGLEGVTAMPGKKTAAASLKPASITGSPYAIHPTTLDQCLQLLGMAACEGLSRHMKHIPLPAGIENLNIRAPSLQGNLKARAIANNVSSEGDIEGELTVVQQSHTVLSVTGIQLSSFNDQPENFHPETNHAVRLSWRPHADFAPLSSLFVPHRKDPSDIRTIEEYGLLCTAEIQARIQDIPDSASHFAKFRYWISDHVAEGLNGENKVLQNSKDLLALAPQERLTRISELQEVLKKSPFIHVAELITRLLDHCVGIFDGSKEVLELYFRDGALTKLYSLTGDRIDSSEFFVTLGHSYPTLKVLEIGAGTGGTTMVALRALTSINDEPMYSHYAFTDISSGFFAAAKERFQAFPGLEFKTLDISKDPAEQGFEVGTYDLIIASNVIHATDSISVSLRNVHRLLSPKGRFFLQELNPAAAKMVNIIMGPLPGWWLGEADGRMNEPIVSIERWDQELRGAGFSGIECVVRDDPNHELSFGANIIAKPAVISHQYPSVVLLINPDQVDSELVRSMKKTLEAHDYFIDECVLGDPIPPHQDLISLVDLEAPFFDQLTPERLEAFQQVLAGMTSARMLWVMGAAQVRPKNPMYSLSMGVWRSIRAEMSTPVATLEIDQTNDGTTETILKVLESYLDQSSAVTTEQEYAVIEGVVHVGRYHWWDMDRELMAAEDISDRALRAKVKVARAASSVKWEVQMATSLGENDVLVKALYVGASSLSTLASHETQLLDCSGEVLAVGKVVDSVKVGDQVMTTTITGVQTSFITAADQVVKLPEGLGTVEAATLPTAFGSAIHCLKNLAGAREGKIVLISEACSDLGLAAVQILQTLGVQFYCRVQSEKESEILQSEFGISADQIVDSVVAVARIQSIDVILNFSSEDLFAARKALTSNAKIISLAGSSAVFDTKFLTGNRSLFSVDMADIQDKLPGLLREIIMLYESDQIKPSKHYKVIEAMDIESALRQVASGPTLGRTVVQLPRDTTTLPAAVIPSPLCFRDDAAYLIVGGLGGLGGALSTYMAEHGARHFVYFSRSATSETHQPFFRELEVQGCTIQAIAGDISDLDSVRCALAQTSRPLAGVLHLGMILCDRPFLAMTQSDWRTAIKPKVDGTWNLHNALLEADVHLDFFIMFGSISGSFGMPHQANYSAGNAFQDAFVQYRQALGLPAATLDIGIVSDVGYVSETPSAQDFFRAGGTDFMPVDELFRALHLSLVQQQQQRHTDMPLTFTPPAIKPTTSNADSTAKTGQAWAKYTSSPGWTAPSQLTLGVRGAKPMTDPTNRVLWKRDRRVDIVRNLEAARSHSHSNSATSNNNGIGGREDRISALTAALRASADPGAFLDEAETLKVLTTEVGRFIYECMLKPVRDPVCSSSTTGGAGNVDVDVEDDDEGEEMELQRSLMTLGVDSLVTIEVRNWLRRRLGVEVSTLEILGGGTIEGLAVLVRERVRGKVLGVTAGEVGAGAGGSRMVG